MSVKYEILKRVVKTAGLKKMWEGKSAEEIVAAKRKENAKNYIPELKDRMFHCYPAFPIVKEAKEGWDKMVDLIRNTTKQGSIKNAI